MDNSQLLEQTASLKEIQQIINKEKKIPTKGSTSMLNVGLDIAYIKIKNHIEARLAENNNPEN